MEEDNAKLYRYPAVSPVTQEDVQRLANQMKLGVIKKDIPDIADSMNEMLQSFNDIEQCIDPLPKVKYPRTPGYKPHPAVNVWNAWAWRCDIKGAKEGKLSGLKVAIKDCIPVAGVPMTNGSKMFNGYIPGYDATVVTRILDAGGHIVGISSCEDLCFSGSSFTSMHGPTFNPNYDKVKLYSAGGSSSGSAALLANGDVDLALGGDQGGSIRIPSCWCNLVGIKPTYGLVPYTGICSIEQSVDHVGPMAKTVEFCALMLEVIAGYDNGLDPRQPPNLTVPEYSKMVTGDIQNFRIGILKEGLEGCNDNHLSNFHNAIQNLKDMGAVVEEVSLSAHKQALSVWRVICIQGFYNTVFTNKGCLPVWKGFYPTTLMDRASSHLKANPEQLGEMVKLAFLLGQKITEEHGQLFYAKAQNLLIKLEREFDKAFAQYDVLVMPTLKFTPVKLPKADESFAERVKNAFGMVENTAPYDVLGYPAITIPIKGSEYHDTGNGLMAVGPKFSETNLFNLGRAVEIATDKSMSIKA